MYLLRGIMYKSNGMLWTPGIIAVTLKCRHTTVQAVLVTQDGADFLGADSNTHVQYKEGQLQEDMHFALAAVPGGAQLE